MMSRVLTHPSKMAHPKSSTSAFDICAMIPVLACAYSTLIQPLIYFNFPPAAGLEGVMESRTENRIFLPAIAAISIALVIRHWPRVSRLAWPPNIISLLAYVAFAGASIAWSFKPELSFIRFVQELMVLSAIVLPAMLAARGADIMRGTFLCFAIAAIVNVLLISGGHIDLGRYGSETVEIGYEGYFPGKNYLGEFAAIAFLLSFHELRHSGLRLVLGIIIAVTAGVLLFLSNSKTALVLTLFAPVLAGLVLLFARMTRVSPAITMSSIALVLVLLCKLTDFSTGRIAYMLTGDSTFTGRAIIWFFAEAEIARSPLVGWGYQSFWLVGPDAPSVVDASGWVKLMPNAHSGYYDTLLELGYVGLSLLAVFLITTLHVIGRVADRNFKHGWLLLSIALFIMSYNFLETLWLRSFDMLWVMFLIVAVEAARYWRPWSLKVPAHGSTPARSVSPGGLRPRWRPRLGARSQGKE